MKGITEFIKESISVKHGTRFADEVDFDLSQWDKWKKSEQNDKYNIYEDPDNGLFTVYRDVNGKEEHIATYLVKDQKLFTDDLDLFGIEK